MDSLIQEPKLIIKLYLIPSGNPDFRVLINDKVVHDSVITKEQELVIEHEYTTDDITVNMMMHGKTDNDTVLDDQGNIISDKYIKINRLIICNFLIQSDHHTENSFIYNNLKYYDHEGKQLDDNMNKMGFWLNEHQLRLTYKHPFYTYFMDNNNSRAKFLKNMDFQIESENMAEWVKNEAEETYKNLHKLLK